MDDAIDTFITRLRPPQRESFLAMDSPVQIQAYLDSVPYIGENLDRSPLRVLQDNQCHCLDGGLLAALALRRIGYPAQVIDLVPEPGTDDDHVLAIFQRNGRFGAVAKSNYVALRYRDPVYRSLRELVMSYFEGFFNLDRQKTLRGYTRPLRLDAFDRYNWMWTETGVEQVAKRLYSLRSFPLLRTADIEELAHMDARSFEALTHGTNMNETFQADQYKTKAN